jgi:hypothetical protein
MDFSALLREQDRAALVVYEIVRQNGGTFQNKTNLFKAFWKAHLNYTRKHGGYLTGWPIVRMPNGPGIGDFDIVLGKLLSEGLIRCEEATVGQFAAFVFEISKDSSPPFSLTANEIEAIREAVQETANKSATSVSKESHDASRTWRDAKDGDELNIYLDLVPDEQYADRKRQMDATVKELASVWG